MNKLIIFDCDGVLVDSEVIAHQVGIEELASVGYSISLEESIQMFTGLSGQRSSQVIYERSGIVIPENFFATVCAPKILEAFQKKLQPLILPVLSSDFLNGIPKCIASSSPRDRVLMSLKVTGQNIYFQDDHVFTSAQVTNGKPAPDLFLFAAKQMGYDPKNCVVIEDSVAGIKAAHAAKMQVIGFLGGSHARFEWYKEWIQNQCVSIAHNPLELIVMIRKLINETLQLERGALN